MIANCVLRNTAGFIIGDGDARASDFHFFSIALNGGAIIPEGGGEISLWCRKLGSTDVQGELWGAQMMTLQVGGFG